VKAGPLECALYEKTPDAVKARVDKIFASLLVQPIPTVIGTGPSDYGLVDYGMVRRTVDDFLYSPFAFGGQNTSLLLASLEKGDGTLFYQTRIDGRNFLQCSCDETVAQDSGGFGMLGTAAIGCSDSDPVNDTVAELQAWYEANKKDSSFADVWPYRIICACVYCCHPRAPFAYQACRGWKIRAAEKFEGTILESLRVRMACLILLQAPASGRTRASRSCSSATPRTR
jgi:hypothetical protein